MKSFSLVLSAAMLAIPAWGESGTAPDYDPQAGVHVACQKVQCAALCAETYMMNHAQPGAQQAYDQCAMGCKSSPVCTLNGIPLKNFVLPYLPQNQLEGVQNPQAVPPSSNPNAGQPQQSPTSTSGQPTAPPPLS